MHIAPNINALPIINDWRFRTMIGLAITFLILAIIAGILGFAGLVLAAAGIAKFLFFIFLVLFLISLIWGHKKHPAA